MNRTPIALRAITFLLLLSPTLPAQEPPFPRGTVIPKVMCSANTEETYALYLPSGYSPTHQWPIIYLFDPFADGKNAVNVVREAAEKFGYIALASNNSKNGRSGASLKAAQAMWQDTQQRFAVDEHRRYVGGLSGGARVATSVALGCDGCIAGVIANAAGFPVPTPPLHSLKFAYFAAVGNADFNFPEFAELRKKLDAIGAAYRIRLFEGKHGWAPKEVWLEALNWMDIRAMAAGSLPRDETRIKSTLNEDLVRAQDFETENDPLAAFREYQAAARDFNGLADVSAVKEKLLALEKNKALKASEKHEASEIEEQARIDDGPTDQMEKISSGNLSPQEFSELRSSVADIKRQATGTDRNTLVNRRALGFLVVHAYESGDDSLEKKDYRAALLYFDLAAVGSSNAAFAHYERARAYALGSNKKEMFAELRLSSNEGFHDPDALSAAEFQPYRDTQDFQALATEWKNAPSKQ